MDHSVTFPLFCCPCPHLFWVYIIPICYCPEVSVNQLVFFCCRCLNIDKMLEREDHSQTPAADLSSYLLLILSKIFCNVGAFLVYLGWSPTISSHVSLLEYMYGKMDYYYLLTSWQCCPTLATIWTRNKFKNEAYPLTLTKQALL